MSVIESIKAMIKGERIERATVLRATTLEGVIRHVVIAGDGIRKMTGYEPGMEISVFVDGQAMQVRRKYSVYRFDPQKGEIELLIHLHGQGPGSAWARLLERGDNVWFRGFSGRITLDHGAQAHWFFGDATTLAPFAAIAAAAHGPCEGVIDGDDRIGRVIEALQLPFLQVDKRNGASRQSGIARTLDLPMPTTIYLAGAASTVRDVQNVLLTERGFETGWVRRKNFWGEHRR
ncbi:siderophore-interacting protein [Silvimonas iriomotensis]|uniref:FAD-binding FR-type domain-containing protein n=1 Tax=Silvimonas iriomotensis TaxID=449662 RepID=A0ABQ2P4V1_9NEIS|nr:siderophore-interacting protein [Silvimonas iriomotensis]GGP18322.1 hypothetical protein GCM10010970_04350 [Silvimonas iriomotensis]